MTAKKSRTLVASAVSLALSSMMLSASLNAGVINNSNNTSTLGLCSVLGAPGVHGACIGAWNLDNVDVQIVKDDDISLITGTFDPATGAYTPMTTSDSFRSYVKNAAGTYMARVAGKDWPVGEPTGIKAVINDTKTKNGKPQNCIINTSYLGADGSSDGLDHYLDSASPEPVICSSGFQTHKRFKIAMLPGTVEGIADGAEGNPIDMVFNVTDESATVRPYQVFSKINNYTGKRLKGYIVQVGTGTGDTFASADEQGIEAMLFISLGISEGYGDTDNNKDTPEVPNGSDLFDDDGGLASFSHGLFGAPDQHFTANGFFDSRTAGFNVEQICSTGTCDQSRVVYPGITVNLTDTIRSYAVLPSNYVQAPVNFGDWLHFGLAPRGIFWDFDNDPTTDADLVAYWNGSTWVKNYDSGFAPVSAAELNAWAADRLYSVDTVEDTVNLGINYIVNVGDGIPGGKVTIRIIPVVADSQAQATPWLENLPAVGDLTSTATTTSGGGGGCAVGGNGRFDPTLPALLAMGLGFFGWRRFKAGK
jgi:hypothetical protein